MPRTYEQAKVEVVQVLLRVLARREDLLSVGVKIDVLMAHGVSNGKGEIVTPAVVHGGYPKAGKIQVLPLIQRVAGRGDAQMVLDGDLWPNLSPDQQLALIDHEITHLVVVTDGVDAATGKPLPATDDCGRPRLKVRKHDWEIGGFAEVVSRHGANAPEYEAVEDMMAKHGELLNQRTAATA
jgi:hypothetical protein